MILIFDRQVKDKCYPNLARHQGIPYTLSWRQFSHHWPYSEPPMLVEYLQHEGIPFEIKTLDKSTENSYYMIAVSFFDFSIDWFQLFSQELLSRLRNKKVRLLFWYSEGDNPQVIMDHLTCQAAQYDVDPDRVWLVSANSAADNIDRAVYFADDELLYRHRNRNVIADPIDDRLRERKFTALVRTHKWWRATIMADIWRSGWHRDAFFSYNPNITVGESPEDNPIEIDQFEGLRNAVDEFLAQGPFTADVFSSDEHNDHTLHAPCHYRDVYFNVILETHMDADQSGGLFITEKTFKPIKHGQPFLMFGCHGTLAQLEKMGYASPEGIDNSYDAIENTTARYAAARQQLEKLANSSLAELRDFYRLNHDVCRHNTQVFLGNKKQRLNILLEKLS